jgi:hypothetical protein
MDNSRQQQFADYGFSLSLFGAAILLLFLLLLVVFSDGTRLFWSSSLRGRFLLGLFSIGLISFALGFIIKLLLCFNIYYAHNMKTVFNRTRDK